MRDFRRELAGETCWDRETQRLFELHGEPLRDCILQNREELIALCQLIERKQLRSYLELGIWTGRLLCALQRLFRFDTVAACDEGWVRRFRLPIHLPPGARYLEARSESEAFLRFRRELGPLDLVFIDANHSYHAVRRDFERAQRFQQRFIVLHDITGHNRHTVGVARLWREIDHGHKLEIIRPQRELGLDHSTMGLGVWSASEPI